MSPLTQEEVIASMQQDISELKDDVHEIKAVLDSIPHLQLSIAKIEGQVGMLAKATNPAFVLAAAFLFGVATYGIVTKNVSEWTALVLYLLGVLVLQHESVNKFARTIFRVKTDRETQAQPAVANGLS